MKLPSDFRDALIQVKRMLDQGNVLEAERILRRLAGTGAHRHLALEALADLYIQQHRIEECLKILRELTGMAPENLNYSVKLANLLDSVGNTDAAIDTYTRLIQHKPGEAIAHFNIALLYKKQERFEEAISAYEQAARLGIDRVEEVYSNMGNLYSEMLDADMARDMYRRAVEIAPDNVSALFNLAGLLEESGERQQAIEIYERIQSIDPRHWRSLALLAYPRKVTSDDQGLVSRITACIDELKDDKLAQEVLYFALGKAYDDLESYEKAGAAFAAANEIGKQRVLPYVPKQTESAFGQLIDQFDSNWIKNRETDSAVSPIFVCGMYRSGSTLLERMLAGHPAIAAGGELKTLAFLVAQHLGSYPQGAIGATKEQLRRIADDYDGKVRALLPDAQFVTDKRPDNFLRLGLARAAFPSARFIQTRRDIRDNCLSIYFHYFSRAVSYANDLQHIAHYFRQQERLFDHWRECFPDSICAVNYEELIEAPETVLRQVLDFVGLEWDARVLDFKQSSGLVKTYSIWQVREGLYSRSRDRWRNYEQLLGGLGEPPPAGSAKV